MYFDNYKFKVEKPVIEKGKSSRSYYSVYKKNDSDGSGIELWKIPADIDNLDILLGYVACIKEPVLFGTAFLKHHDRIINTIHNAKF